MFEVNVQNVAKRFPDGTLALAGVDLRIAPGERVVLLGHNGSGKSTLLRCLVGLVPVTSGRIQIGNVDMTTARGRVLRQARGQIGFVFQRFNLVGSLSVLHNVLHGALGRSQGPACWWPLTAPEEERNAAMACLSRVGLDTFAGRRADTLSGGQQQRLALARTLMQRPRLILADEPVANLDPKAGREVMDLLWSISREQDLTLVCALHQLDLAQQYGETLVGLRQGRIILEGQAASFSRDELERIYDTPPVAPPRPVPATPGLIVANHG